MMVSLSDRATYVQQCCATIIVCFRLAVVSSISKLNNVEQEIFKVEKHFWQSLAVNNRVCMSLATFSQVCNGFLPHALGVCSLIIINGYCDH